MSTVGLPPSNDQIEQKEGANWINHKGGRRPVDGFVECRCRDGSIVSGRAKGMNWRWDRQPPGLDILSYRVIEDES